jgi:NTE family protein
VIAFVLGGGGLLGAVEVGMLQALLEAGVRPDLVLGSSVGALNGAAVATEPDLDSITRLSEIWETVGRDEIFSGGVIARLGTLARSGTHLHANAGLRRLLDANAPGALIEDLAVPFQCVAACIETARTHWFAAGSLTEAVLASSAVPGLLPPVRIGDRHYMDGGLVDSIPVGRACALGATTIYVLQVGRIERPLVAPRWPWEVATVAFEIARRHRFGEEMAELPEHLDVHVLPSGEPGVPLANVRYRDTTRIGARIRSAYQASTRYLADLAPGS